MRKLKKKKAATSLRHIDVNMQIKLETQRCVMAPSLIRSVCRKSPREGGAVYSLFVGIVLLCCLPMMAIHLVTVVVSTRSFFFSVEFASLVNLDIYCMSSHLPFSKTKVAEAIYQARKRKRKRKRDCVATNGTHTWLLVSFICLLLSRWKVFPQGHLKGPLKMVSNVFCCCSRNVFVFCPFFCSLEKSLVTYFRVRRIYHFTWICQLLSWRHFRRVTGGKRSRQIVSQ